MPMHEGRKRSSDYVLDGANRIVWIVVFVLHEEMVNQFPSMVFYGDIFLEDEVSVRTMDHEYKAPFPVQAIMEI
jgi:hypothetical protein